MKKIIILAIFIFFFLSLFITKIKVNKQIVPTTKTLSQVLFINQVRGGECCAKGTLDNLKLQINAFTKLNVPAGFALRYDVLTNKKYVDFLAEQSIKYPAITRLGLMIEVTPQLAKDAGVKYKEKESTWFEAQNAFTIGYPPEERKKLVDFLFKKFFENFGYYPNLTSAWMIDTNTLNYINKKYGIKAHQITREQQETDSYTLYGGPPHYPYPASYKWLLVPDYQRNNAPLIVRQTVTDPVYNFGDKTNAFTSQPNDYANDGKTFEYFKQLVYQALFNQPKGQTGFALLGLENSMDLKFQEEYLKQINYIASLKKEGKIILPDVSQLKTFWPEKKITVYYGKDLINNLDKFVYWITTPKYRLRLLLNNRELSISDLRIYDKTLVDPYLKIPAKKGGHWIIPKKEVVNIYGKLTLPKIKNRDSLIINPDNQQDFIFSYQDEKGKTITLENKFDKIVSMQIWIYSLFSVLIVSLIAFIGIITFPIKEKRLKNILLYFISFSAGALLGDVFIHLLPEAVAEGGFSLSVSINILLGIVTSLILEKFIHARHIHLAGKISRFRSVSIMSLFGDAIHNFIDGLIISASFLINIQVGIASTIAVILHEIPQEMGNFAVLLHGGFTKNRALFLNFLTALTAFLGVIVLLTFDVYAKNVTQFLIPFAAGNFIYIAGSDLIPELQREVKLKKSFIQIVTFILGIAVMYGLLIVG